MLGHLGGWIAMKVTMAHEINHHEIKHYAYFMVKHTHGYLFTASING